jgi:hypothetical protein
MLTLLPILAAVIDPVPLKETTIQWMFIFGVGAVAAAWIILPLGAILMQKSDMLVEILRQGTVLRYITVTYIVIIVVTLAMIGRMQSDQVSTILASIAGYVLGQGTRQPHASESRTQESETE